MQMPSVVEMLKAGVHFGHQSARWHPKMKPYIFGIRQGVHVIDVEKTQAKLTEAMDYITDIVAKGGTILFVGTKRQAQDVVAEHAKDCGMPYVNVRWLGGTLTNFAQVQRLTRHYVDLKDKREKGELRKYTKLEQLNFDREIAELEGKIGGLVGMNRLPEALYIVDARHDKTVVREATAVGVPMVALVDTNVNPEGIKKIIPANDDAVTSISLVTRMIADAVKTGKAKALANRPVAEVRKNAEDDVRVSDRAKEVVSDMDDKMKEKLVAEALNAKPKV